MIYVFHVIANLSLGCKCNSSALKEAIDKSVAQNVIYVVAAGNIHADASFFRQLIMMM
jgi:Subtilase family